MMASYINFTPDVFGIQHPHGIKVWQFPEEFSQSRLGDRLVGKLNFKKLHTDSLEVYYLSLDFGF